jgi:hypothetical protein
MPIPNATEATAATEKVRDYLLNPEHPDGGSKAAWFQSLGYARDRWHELASDLLALAATCEQFATVRTPFGVKYVLKGPNRSWTPSLRKRIGCMDSRGRSSSSTRNRVSG